MGTSNGIPKPPNTYCSINDCNNLCVDSGGHRVRRPHTARGCCVCARWYCGIHKQLMRRANSENEKSYKCTGCKGTKRTYFGS